MANKRIFLFFVDSFLNFCKANKNCDYSANFQSFCIFLLLHGASLCGFHICFWYHSNPTWNDWDMAKIYSEDVFVPPWIVSSGPALNRFKLQTWPNKPKLFYLKRNCNLFLGICNIWVVFKKENPVLHPSFQLLGWRFPYSRLVRLGKLYKLDQVGYNRKVRLFKCV